MLELSVVMAASAYPTQDGGITLDDTGEWFGYLYYTDMYRRLESVLPTEKAAQPNTERNPIATGLVNFGRILKLYGKERRQKELETYVRGLSEWDFLALARCSVHISGYLLDNTELMDFLVRLVQGHGVAVTIMLDRQNANKLRGD